MKHTVIFLSLALIFMACKNSDSPTTETTKPGQTVPVVEPGPEGNLVYFKVNDETVSTTPLGITRMSAGSMQVLNIITDREKHKQTVNISVNAIAPGIYPFADGFEAMKKEGGSFGSYTPDAKNDALNIYSFTEGSVELLSVDTLANIVNATFSGTARNAKGETIKVTEGKISQGRMTPGIIR